MAARLAPLLAAVVAACVTSGPLGYHPQNPTELTCPCDDGQSCYQMTVELAEQRGETAETGEGLLALAQCACFQGSSAGCNTLAHFGKDYLASCEAGREVATSCTIAGMIHRHALRVPAISGRSYDRDPAAAKSAFDRACQAGARVACEAAQDP